MSALFNWDDLNLGDSEDPKEVSKRLDKIHEDMLKSQGLAYEPGKNSPGFRPSVAQAREVSVMSCMGLEPKDIALVLNIELKLLNLYYSKELKVSKSLANVAVARVALRMAMSGASADMTKFWLKSQAGWQEKQSIDITSKGENISGMSAKEKVAAALASAGKAGSVQPPPSDQTEQS